VPARGRSAAKRAPTPGRRFMLPCWEVGFQGDHRKQSRYCCSVNPASWICFCSSARFTSLPLWFGMERVARTPGFSRMMWGFLPEVSRTFVQPQRSNARAQRSPLAKGKSFCPTLGYKTEMAWMCLVCAG